jgi:hypothetical protein
VILLNNFRTGSNRCQKWGAPILDAPEGRRDDFVDPYFKHAKKDQVVVVLKAREPARIMIAIGSEDRWHLQLAQRWIVQYNFYINDPNWGRMFVLALMHALVCFAHIAAGSTFTTAELYPYVLAALQISATQYSLAPFATIYAN